MRGVTLSDVVVGLFWSISTHTPHARRDMKAFKLEASDAISTHTPHARRDQIILNSDIIILISTHTPHARRDGIPV